MTTPDPTTETDEALEDLLDAVCNTNVYDDWAAMREAAAPHLAAIRRQAAADALKQQEQVLRQVNRDYLKRLQRYDHGSEAYNLTFARGQQVTADARRLANAAQDVIAEGWEHTCHAQWAATRTDPGYGCDTPVENEGDYCPRHEPEDEEDRWAE